MLGQANEKPISSWKMRTALVIRMMARGRAIALAVCALLLAAPAPAADFLVESTADTVDALPGDGVCADASAACTLRAAVMETNALAGEDTVVVPPGTYPLELGGLSVGDGLIVSGAGADVTIIDAAGSQPPVWCVFEMGWLERRPVGPVELRGLTITGGASGVGVFYGSEVRLLEVAVDGSTFGVEQSDAGHVRIERSVISGDFFGLWSVGRYESKGMGCICAEVGTLALANTTVSGRVNTGGDFSCTCGNTTSIVSSTLTGDLYTTAYYGTTTLQSSIIASCVSFLPPTSAGHNLDSDGTCVLTDPTDLPNTDPMLGPLQDNGGPTWTHALLPGSPAIDAIPLADCTYDDDGDPGTPEVPLAADQRGVSRPQGVACDIGAHERVPVPTPTPTPTATPSPTPTPLPVGDVPMCKLRRGKQMTVLVPPPKVPGSLAKGLTMGECPAATNGVVMCGSRRGKLTSVVVPHRKVQRSLARGLTPGACRAP